jgi:excisionase family DNA binding protein
LKSVASRDHGEPRLFGRRLLSAEQAAAYLGLRSRFAIYRLVARGRLRALRLANKLRLDLQDLDSMIEDSKVESTGNVDRSQSGPAAARSVPRELAPNRRRRSVTSRVTVQARPN